MFISSPLVVFAEDLVLSLFLPHCHILANKSGRSRNLLCCELFSARSLSIGATAREVTLSFDDDCSDLMSDLNCVHQQAVDKRDSSTGELFSSKF